MHEGIWFTAILGLAIAGIPATARAQTSPFRAPPSVGVPAPPPGALRENAGPPRPGAVFIPEQPGNALLATEYLGSDVYGPGKQKVGTITNLLLDTTGRITGVVLNVGEFLGIGAKEVAISFEALFPVREDDRDAFLIEMSKAQLTAAPAFARAKAPP